MKLTNIITGMLLLAAPCASGQQTTPQDAQPVHTATIYKKGDNGFDTYRIPATVRTKKGTVLAFAEARKHSRSDTGDIDLVLRRSTDGGRTWGDIITFWDDFSWVEADWGEQQINGQLAEIMPWYASVDPPTANSAAQREQQWTSLKNQEHIAVRDSKGYLTPGTFQPTGTARFIFFRNSTILFTFDANPLHTVSGGAWSIPDSKNALKLKITLSGAGSFKEGEAVGEVLLDNPSGLEGGWPVDRWNNLSVTVYGADADTQIVIGTPNEPDTPARFMVDNFVIKEVL